MDNRKSSEILRMVVKYRSFLVAALSLVYLVIQVYSVVHQDFELALGALGAAVLLAAVGIVGYVVLSKVESSLVLAEDTGEARRVYRFSRTLRVGVIWMVFLLAAGILSVTYLFRYDFGGEKTFVILVAQMDGPRQDAYRVQEILVSNLRDSLEAYGGAEVIPIEESISPSDSERPHEILAGHDGDLILWGWYGATESAVKLELKVSVAEDTCCYSDLIPGVNRIQSIEEFETFSLQVDLSREVAGVVLLVRALASMKAADWEGAALFFQGARDQFPKVATSEGMPSLGILHASVLQLSDRWEESLRVLNESIEEGCCVFDAVLLRAHAYERQARFDLALRDLEWAAEVKPTACGPEAMRGYILAGTGRHDEALQRHKHAIELNGGCGTLPFMQMGWIYRTRGQYSNAIWAYSEALAIDSELTFAYLGRARSFLEKGELREADADVSRVFAIGRISDPSVSGLAYLLRGRIRIGNSQLAGGIRDLSLAVRLMPTDYQGYIYRSRALLKDGQLSGAVQDASMAISLLRTSYVGFRSRSEIHLSEGRPSLGEFDERRAGFVRAELGRALLLRSQLRRELGQDALAHNDLASAQELASAVLRSGVPIFRSTMVEL